MEGVFVNEEKVTQLAKLLRLFEIPEVEEGAGSFVIPEIEKEGLANAYFFLVGICHQTSPVGERRLEGKIHGATRYGWDYLKEKYFIALQKTPAIATPDAWRGFTPKTISDLFADDELGLTLNRINERTYFINDLGETLLKEKIDFVSEAFDLSEKKVSGERGFLKFLAKFVAYSDPLRKKSFFFLSLALSECKWAIADQENILSPVDYHELRGHLRIGTIKVEEPGLKRKLAGNLVISNDEDNALRYSVQQAMTELSDKTGLSPSQLHYFFWNVFRNCCPRNPLAAHCEKCEESCTLPAQYKNQFEKHCVFSPVCSSAGKSSKVMEPPYMGHFY